MGDEPDPRRLGGCLAARPDRKLPEYRRDVVIHRFLRQEEALPYLGVAKPLGDEGEDLDLPHRQVGGVLPCRSTWSSRKPADTAVTQATRDRCRRRLGPQTVQFVEGTSEWLVLVRVRERECGLVRTADLGDRKSVV